MDYNNYFYLLIGILLFDFIFEFLLDYLNTRKMSPIIPDAIKDIYDKEKYAHQQNYMRENVRFGKFSGTLNFVVTALAVLLGLLGSLDNYLASVIGNELLRALVFFGIVGLLSQLISIPFEWYSTFSIEEKYGFNKSTKKLFISDKLKGALLTIVLGGGLYTAVFYIYEWSTEWFWLLTFGVMATFTLLITMFYTTLLLPLFNKQKPLEKGDLRSSIEAMALEAGFNLDNIFVMDGSKRSTKANAFFSGLGFKKRIVLYDTLIKDLTTNEIVAVLAHEIGHYKKKHTLIGLAMSLTYLLIMLYILGFFVGNEALCSALGANQPSFHISLLAFGMLYSPVSFIMGTGTNIISRKNEYEADNFAKKHHSADELVKALKKLSVNSLSNLTPHKAYVFFNYSHPPILSRIKNLTK